MGLTFSSRKERKFLVSNKKSEELKDDIENIFNTGQNISLYGPTVLV